MRYLSIILFFVISLSLNAQDKKAKKVLDKLSDRYTNLSSISIDFDLVVKYPEEEAVSYPSQVVQQGEQFVFKNSEHEYYGDGEDIWVYIVEQNEVQINDFEEEDAEDYFITPLDLLNQYKNGQYAYHMSMDKGSTKEIEFKPLDEFADYSKFRIIVDAKQNAVSKIIGFGKEGTRITVDIVEVIENETYPAELFLFDKSKYPGVRIEDLRLD